MNRDHSVIFEIATKYCISDSLFTMMANFDLARYKNNKNCTMENQESIVNQIERFKFSKYLVFNKH